MCWLVNDLAQLKDEGFGNICVPREEIPSPRAMTVRVLLCAGSLVAFLLCLCPGSPENSSHLILLNSSVANGGIPKFKWNNPEQSFPQFSLFLFLHSNIPGDSQGQAVPKWVTEKLQESGNGSNLCLCLLALIFPYPQPL